MITTYQIRNVLRVYGNQLKKRSEETGEHGNGIHQPNDFVDISIAARRKQIVSQMSSQLISGISSKDAQKRAGEESIADLQAKEPENQ